MKFLTFGVLALVASSLAEDKISKRGAVGYTGPTSRPSYSVTGSPDAGPSTYSKLSPASLKSFGSPVQYLAQPSSKYSSSPAGFESSQQYDFDPQAFNKASFASAPTQQQSQISYSPASDVSSFSYASPSVQYNSQGFLQQFAGKFPGGAGAAAAAPEPQFQGAFAKGGFAASAGPVSFAAPSQKYAFASPAYSGGATKVQYAAAPQQYVYQQQPAAYSPQQFAAAPGYANLQSAQSQQVYAVAPSQYSRYQPPQGVTYSHVQ